MPSTSQSSKQDKPPITKTCCGGCVYSPVIRLDENEVLRRSCWCIYCCCCGWGCSRMPLHLRLAYKCLCCQASSEYAECYGVDGCCSHMHSCCHCMSICHLPHIRGTPRCVCCMERFCGLMASGEDADTDRGIDKEREAEYKNDISEPRTSDFDFFLHETKVCCYCCCTGISVAPCRHVCNVKHKYGCCKCNTSSTECLECGSGSHGCCSMLLTCLWLQAQCRLPPSCAVDLNPIVALCGCKLRNFTRPVHTIGPHGPSARKHQPIGIATPVQQTMPGHYGGNAS